MVPVFVHSYLGLKRESNALAQNIPKRLGGFNSTFTDRPKDWGELMFGSDDWIERRYFSRWKKNIRLFAAQSYDLKKLYHYPEKKIVPGADLVERGTLAMKTMPGLVVHLVYPREGPGVGAYALYYDDYFVENPILFQLQTALQLLFRGRSPMTLFLVYDREASPDNNFETTAAGRILVDAIKSFRSHGIGSSVVDPIPSNSS